jgi:hypothetical protein
MRDAEDESLAVWMERELEIRFSRCRAPQTQRLPLPREAKTGGINRDEPGHRSRASLRGHCRSARWLMVSACDFRVKSRPLRQKSPTIRIIYTTVVTR